MGFRAMVWTSVERSASPTGERFDAAQKIATPTLIFGQRTGMGQLAPFRPHRDRGCLPPMTGPK